jgi:hypothetical protein
VAAAYGLAGRQVGREPEHLPRASLDARHLAADLKLPQYDGEQGGDDCRHEHPGAGKRLSARSGHRLYSFASSSSGARVQPMSCRTSG